MVVQKPVVWMGSSLDDLRAFPEAVRRVLGLAIFDAQNGDEHPSVKSLKGFGGRNVLEVVDDFDGDTYRAVYTVRYSEAVYVLDIFQKKSKKGSATPKHDMDRIKLRLKNAEQHHNQTFPKGMRP